MSKLIDKALKFATQKHGEIDHRRRYTNEPYITHPIAVAKMVKEYGGIDAMIASSLLHDTIEDTNTTIKEIVQTFGIVVGAYVTALTEPERVIGVNRAQRQSAYNKQLGEAPAAVHTIKLADGIDNMPSIAKHDPKFWATYRKEKSIQFLFLSKGHPELKKIFESILKNNKI